jgi:hypothetical protein
MEIFEHDHEGLRLARAQEQTLDAVKELLAALRRVKPLKGGIIDRNVQDPEQGRPSRLEVRIEGKRFPVIFSWMFCGSSRGSISK